MKAAAPNHEPRPASIVRWLAAQGHATRELTPLTGDISLRRYFRAHLREGSAIVAYYPVKLRSVCRRFRLTSELLAAAGVPVPTVLAADCRRGLMLIAEAGVRTLYEEPARSWSQLAPIYRRAVDSVRRIQALPRAAVATLNPPLDAELLRWELRKSWELFLLPAGLAGTDAEAAQLEAALATLCARLGATAELVPAHRDFMVRNLMLRGDGELLVLDHQDLRLAPRAYDLASLLNDSLFPPPWLESELLAELLPGTDGELAYARAVVQRTIKAIGNYCDFARRGHARHLSLVRPSLRRAWRWFPRVPELAPLVPPLAARWDGWLASLGDAYGAAGSLTDDLLD
jgi:aminoglycoside/choline kinase family phosphotransferase